MKIVSQTICHYGSDYLGWALRSVAPFVDQCYVFYAEQPSHGATLCNVCPDSKESIYVAIEATGLGDKVKVIEGEWNNEGDHRNEIYKHTSVDDIIVVVDADEIWIPDRLQYHIQQLKDGTVTQQCIRLATLWRSFDWIVRDEMQPTRMIKVVGDGRHQQQFSGELDMYHFGYARGIADIAYKIYIHGHRAEWRDNWLFDKYISWKPYSQITDVHPTCVGFWYPMPFDRLQLPIIMRDHPYWQTSVIA